MHKLILITLRDSEDKMKNLIIIITILLSSLLFAQTSKQNVSFIHGLGGDEETWQDSMNKLLDEFLINAENIEYDESQRLSLTAGAYYDRIQNNSVLVAHSMGGLLSREMIRQRGTSKIDALITTGTPHTGAMISEYPGNASKLLGKWIVELARPWAILVGSGPEGESIAEQYVKTLFDKIGDFVNTTYDIAKPSMLDMHRNSSFLNTINSGGANNFPSAHYTIWGKEDWLTPWRLGDVAEHKYEKGNWVKLNRKLQTYYDYLGNLSSILAIAYWSEYIKTWNYNYLSYYNYFDALAFAFYYGAYSLSYLQQAEWDAYLTGSLTSSKWYSDDGVVPAHSQAPDLVDRERRLVANHTNHLEETRPYGEGLQKIRDAFIMPDINIPEDIIPLELSISINGPTSLNRNQTADFAANVTGGSNNYSDYRWWWRSDGDIDFEPLGHGVRYVAPGNVWYELIEYRGQSSIQIGKPSDFSLKCEVTDTNGDKKTDIHSITVQ